MTLFSACQETAGSEVAVTASQLQASPDTKAVTTTQPCVSVTHQQPIQTYSTQNVLSRISEDSPRPSSLTRCLNITGIEKYPELQGALPRAWSVPALAPHVRSDLEAPLVTIILFSNEII